VQKNRDIKYISKRISVGKIKIIREISWEETIPVRHRVLWPDKPTQFCHVGYDNDGWHFGFYLDQELVSVASVYPNNDSARLRKMATLEEVQGQGIGTELLEHIITTIRNKGIRHFWCDARETVTEFYERFGMQSEGKRFYKSNVPYFKMSIVFTE